MATNPAVPEAVWPLRVWVLAVLGALLAFAIHQLMTLPGQDTEWQRRLLASAPILIGVTGLAFGLAWEKGRLLAALAVALLCGLIGGSVHLWHGVPREGLDPLIWHLVCGLGAAGVLLILFQAAQDRVMSAPAPESRGPGGLRARARAAVRYEDVHRHLWTDALLIGAGILFTLIVFAVAHLLAAMFALVKLGFLRELLREPAFVAVLVGAAFGAGLGLLRDRGPIITALQRVALLVLRVLAPVLAIGVFVFLAALPVTGLAPLWETGDTTPIMLAGAALALFLANAVVGDTPRDESRSILLNSSAAALGLFVLPMVGIAAYSSGLRIQQHGLSPERLWALAFIVVASIVAVAYGATILGRRGWFARLRRTNLHLAFLVAGIALLLSTPILGFERIATAHQLHRLAGGQVSRETFDYKGLWFDFGPPGRAAIERMAAQSSDPVIRRYAAQTTTLGDRWQQAPNELAATRRELDRLLVVLPEGAALDPALRREIERRGFCWPTAGDCVARHVPGEDFAIAVQIGRDECRTCASAALFRREGERWTRDDALDGTDRRGAARIAAALRSGEIEMRPVGMRRIFVGEEPVGGPIPPADAGEP